MAKYRMFAELILDLPADLPPTVNTMQLAAEEFKKQIALAPLPRIRRKKGDFNIAPGRALWNLNNDPTDHAVWVLENPQLEIVEEEK
jgi:hypothetical protein